MQDGLGMGVGAPTERKRPVSGSILNTATLLPGIFAQSRN
jgi:hypothetical protein